MVRNCGNSSGKYFCQFDVFTEDNGINQILKFTCEMFRSVVTNYSTRRVLDEIAFILAGISFHLVHLADFDRIHFNRLNEQFKPIIEFCRLFLEHSTVEFHAGKLETFAFVFDMNKLFEEFIYEFIHRNKTKIQVNGQNIIDVVAQKTIGKIFGEFSLKTDITIHYIEPTSKSTQSLLIDTKYKSLFEKKTHQGVTTTDIHQMFTYSQSQVRKYPDIILIYPKTHFNAKVLDKDLIHKMSDGSSIRLLIRTIQLDEIFDINKKKIKITELISEFKERIFVF